MSVATTVPGTDEHTASPATPGPPITRLIAPGDPQPVHTAVRTTDSRTAITRGLAEYVLQVRGESENGRSLSFQKVFENWARPEDQAEYPSAIAYTTTMGTYDASRLTSFPSTSQQIPVPDGRYVVTPADYVVPVTLEVWSTDDEERMGLVALLEDAFNPHVGQGRYGFTLELPHYYNVRASFEPTQMGYVDDEASAMSGNRNAIFMLEATMPIVRLVTFPSTKPSHKLAEIGPDVIVENC